MNTLQLNDEQIKLLKEALLCAEISREKENSNWQAMKDLHEFIDTQIQKVAKVWKVEYHKSDDDWRKGIITTSVFYDTKQAYEFTTSRINWHMGPVRIIHPD